jgi:hypothetical protein
MSKIGFTGTRRGMSDAQLVGVEAMLKHMGATELHHGDCIGADVDANALAVFLKMRKVVHPPIDQSHRGFADKTDETREPKTHFARNRDIVDETEALIATPWQATRPAPKTGGGTWYTIEYAIKRGKPVYVVWPDGSREAM